MPRRRRMLPGENYYLDPAQRMPTPIVVRLPPGMKALIEAHAKEAGMSVNTWIVAQLARAAES